MRVLAVGNVYPPHALGGYEIVWRGATRCLREHGHRARILTTDFYLPGVEQDPSGDEDVHRQLRWYWHDHEWPRMRMRERLALERHNAAVLDRHVLDFSPQLVAWWGMGGLSLSLIERVRRAGLPAVLFVHDYWPSYGPQRDLWTRAWAGRPALGRPVERLTGIPARYDLAHAGRWLFNSECVRQRTLESGFDVQDSELLPPGIDSSYLRIEREEQTPDWDWRLLYVGRVVEQKAVHTAIEALARLPGDAKLRIVGDGDESYGRRLRELSARLGVAARVRFEPSRPGEKVWELYREADAVVFPVQWDEPWGLVPLEAMASGRPVIATGKGGSGDYLRDRVNCLIFAAGDPVALAASLTTLADDPELQRALRTGGYETAAHHGETAFNLRAMREMQSVARAARAARDSGNHSRGLDRRSSSFESD